MWPNSAAGSREGEGCAKGLRQERRSRDFRHRSRDGQERRDDREEPDLEGVAARDRACDVAIAKSRCDRDAEEMSRRVSCGASTDDRATSAMKPRMVAISRLVQFPHRQLRCHRSHGLGDDAGGETRGLRFSGELAQPPKKRCPRLGRRARPRAVKDDGAVAPAQGEPVFVSEDAIRLCHRVVVNAEIDGEPTDGRQWRSDREGAGHEQGTKRAGDLAIRGHGRGQVDADGGPGLHCLMSTDNRQLPAACQRAGGPSGAGRCSRELVEQGSHVARARRPVGECERSRSLISRAPRRNSP